MKAPTDHDRYCIYSRIEGASPLSRFSLRVDVKYLFLPQRKRETKVSHIGEIMYLFHLTSSTTIKLTSETNVLQSIQVVLPVDLKDAQGQACLS